MAVTHGRLECLITVPTGGWTFVLSEDSSDVGTVSLAAGDTFYWGSAGSAARFANGASTGYLRSKIMDTGAGTYSVFMNDGEDDTGKLQITVSGGASAWGMHTFKQNGVANNALRDLLGFDADVTVDVASATGDSQVQCLWLPNRPWYNGYGSGDWGDEVADARTSISPAGDVSGLFSQRYERMRLSWQGLSRAKTRIAGETTNNESLQQFYRDCMLGELGCVSSMGGPLRFYPDAADDATYTTGRMLDRDLRRHVPRQLKERWIGAWNVGWEWIVQ